jgi:hypothetical protein
MSSLPIADATVPVEAIVDAIAGFSRGTVRWYDKGGSTAAPPAVDGVHLVDLGRMAAMNPDLTGDDVVHLLEADIPAELWSAVAMDADLADADPAAQGGLYDAALALYEAFRGLRGIKDAKTSKLLHLKRPSLYPVLDLAIRQLYDGRARRAASSPDIAWRGFQTAFWPAIREDLIAWRRVGAFDDIRASLVDLGRPDHAELTDVRLLDVAAWRMATGKMPT